MALTYEEIITKLQKEETVVEINSKDVMFIGVNPSDADAVPSDVILGKGFYAGDDEKKYGTFDLSLATATEERVQSGFSFYAGDKMLKEGTGTFVNPTLATAVEEDVFADATFYAGSEFSARTGALDPIIEYMYAEDLAYELVSGRPIPTTDEYVEIKDSVICLLDNILEGVLYNGC